MKKLVAMIMTIMIISSAVGTSFAYGDSIELPADEIETTTVSEQDSSEEQTSTSVQLSEDKSTATEPTVTEPVPGESETSETSTTVTEPLVTETETSSTEPSTVTEPTVTVPTTTQPTTVKPVEPKVVKVKKVKLSKTILHLSKKGKSKTLKVKITPSNATNKKVKWSTSNKKVAKVNQSGKVTAKGIGACTVRATARDGSKKYAKCLVVVGQYVKGIELPKSVVINRGSKVKLKAKITNKKAAYKAVNWTTSNKKVATVNTNGKVTAKAKGKCTIKATAKDGSKKTAKCKITVRQLVTKVALSKSKVDVIKGKTVKLKANISPTNANNKTVKWSTSNKKIATVNKNGKVKGINLGKCTVKATAQDGSKKAAKCTVNVTFDDNTKLTHKQLCTKAVMQRVCDKMNKWYGNAGATIDKVVNGNSQYCLSETIDVLGRDVSINEFTLRAMMIILNHFSEDTISNGGTWNGIKAYDYDAYAKWYDNLSDKDILDPVKSGWSEVFEKIDTLIYCSFKAYKADNRTEYIIYFYYDVPSTFYPTDED